VEDEKGAIVCGDRVGRQEKKECVCFDWLPFCQSRDNHSRTGGGTNPQGGGEVGKKRRASHAGTRIKGKWGRKLTAGSPPAHWGK